MATTSSSSGKKSASKTAKKKSTTRKKTAGQKAVTGKSASPLVDVARKIGSTLGSVAVRTGIVKPGGEGSSGQ